MQQLLPDRPCAGRKDMPEGRTGLCPSHTPLSQVLRHRPAQTSVLGRARTALGAGGSAGSGNSLREEWDGERAFPWHRDRVLRARLRP